MIEDELENAIISLAKVNSVGLSNASLINLLRYMSQTLDNIADDLASNRLTQSDIRGSKQS